MLKYKQTEKEVYALVVAAGLSSRMGRFKPCLAFKDKTIIESSIDSILNSQVKKVFLVLGYRAEEVRKLLRGKYSDRLIITENKNFAETDMFESIKIGCRVMPQYGVFFLVPADMPLIQPNTYRMLINAQRNNPQKTVFFPVLRGKRKHPPLIDCKLIPDIIGYRSTDGMRSFWNNISDQILEIKIEDEGTGIDLDTFDDYKKYNTTNIQE